MLYYDKIFLLPSLARGILAFRHLKRGRDPYQLRQVHLNPVLPLKLGPRHSLVLLLKLGPRHSLVLLLKLGPHHSLVLPLKPVLLKPDLRAVFRDKMLSLGPRHNSKMQDRAVFTDKIFC